MEIGLLCLVEFVLYCQENPGISGAGRCVHATNKVQEQAAAKMGSLLKQAL